MELSELLNWETFLRMLTNPTALPLFVGVALSLIAEYARAYQALEPKWKRAVFFGVSLLIPLLGALLGVWTLGWSPGWAVTFWPALMAGVIAFGSGTLTHMRKLPGAPTFSANIENRLR